MSEPIVAPRTYLLVFAALLVLTASTVGLSYVDLGRWHAPTGLLFAVAKAMLVVLFFMHVIHSSRLTWIIALTGLFWLGILLGLTMTDYLTRSWPT